MTPITCTVNIINKFHIKLLKHNAYHIICPPQSILTHGGFNSVICFFHSTKSPGKLSKTVFFTHLQRKESQTVRSGKQGGLEQSEKIKKKYQHQYGLDVCHAASNGRRVLH